MGETKTLTHVSDVIPGILTSIRQRMQDYWTKLSEKHGGDFVAMANESGYTEIEVKKTMEFIRSFN